MSLRINSNIAAMDALLNINNTQDDITTSIERLSSGLRINNAADDPAGLIVSEDLRSKIQGIGQAISNSQDAINMSKTAEGAMNEIQTLIGNMNSLAVAAANSAVVDAATLQADQTQIQSSIESINRIASTTQFGNKFLLNGSAGISANVTDPTDVSGMFMGGTFGGANIANGPVTMTQSVAASEATLTLGNSFATTTSIVPAGTFVINGQNFSTDGTESLNAVMQKINAQTSNTGVSAQIVPAAGGKYSIQLNQTTYGSQYPINFVDGSKILSPTANPSATAGTDAVYSVSVTTDQGPKTVLFTGGQGAGVSGLKLTDSTGNSILLTQAGNTNLGTTPTAVGVNTVGSVRFQIGADPNQAVQYSLPSVFANMLGTGAVPGKSLADIDLTTTQGAQDAMKIIAAAVTQIAQERGQLGSFQKDFLESNVRSLNVASQNLTSSESQVRDTDFASETANYSRLQILQQSGMSVLAQANKQPQSVLSLLQNL